MRFLPWETEARAKIIFRDNYLCNCNCIRSAKTDPVRFKWGFGEGRLKDKFAFFQAYKNPIPKRRKLLAKRPFLEAKRVLFRKPFKLDRVSFSTPDQCNLARKYFATPFFMYVMFLWTTVSIAIGAAIYRSPEALWARNPQKVSKRCSRASRPRVSKKCRKKSRMTRKESKRLQNQCSGDFFGTFLTLRAGRPGNTLLRLFGDFGARGCGDSCIWGFAIAR